MSNNPIHFKGLYALRFLAALLIIVYHTTAGFHAGMTPDYRQFFQNLIIGVDLFFLISGFLIIYLLLQEKKTTGSIHMGKFYLRRVLRIFPLYFLIVGLAYWMFHNTPPEINYSRYLYFWGNFYSIEINNWPGGYLTPLWSVCIEEHFYLVIPLLVLVTPLRRVHWVLLAVVAASMCYRYAQVPTDNWFKIYCHTLSRCDLMAIGGLLAVWHTRKPISFSISAYLPFALLLGLLFWVMAILNYSDYTTVVNAVWKKYAFALPMLLMIVLLVFNRHKSVLLFENKALQYLGKISYGLYMFHVPMNELIFQYSPLSKYIFEWRPLHTLQVLLPTILVAAISYEFFEKRFLALKFKAQVVPAS